MASNYNEQIRIEKTLSVENIILQEVIYYYRVLIRRRLIGDKCITR